MLFYLLYRIGSSVCLIFPQALSYGLACAIADLCCFRSSKDREAVRRNLAAVLEVSPEQVSSRQIREVFRNFAIYLVDFFRFSRLDPKEVHRRVRLEGLEHMKQALKSGKGAIGLSAHLGNYELAGAVLSLLGLPVKAVVLTHQNPHVDDFFTRQRSKVGVEGIPIQRMSRKQFLETSLSALRRNQILALVGDRDFFDHGSEFPLFGRRPKIPTGPAAFSIRSGAPIVPAFLVRESDGSYRFFIEPPIVVPQGVPRGEAQRQITQQCLNVMARYIRRYPTQWYLFQDFWRTAPAVIP